jgi:hypothetical protein
MSILPGAVARGQRAAGWTPGSRIAESGRTGRKVLRLRPASGTKTGCAARAGRRPRGSLPAIGGLWPGCRPARLWRETRGPRGRGRGKRTTQGPASSRVPTDRRQIVTAAGQTQGATASHRISRAFLLLGWTGVWVQLIFLIVVGILGICTFSVVGGRAGTGNILAFRGPGAGATRNAAGRWPRRPTRRRRPPDCRGWRGSASGRGYRQHRVDPAAVQGRLGAAGGDAGQTPRSASRSRPRRPGRVPIPSRRWTASASWRCC